MEELVKYLDKLRYHHAEGFWVTYCPDISSEAEIYVQGNEEEISPDHLTLAKRILSELEHFNDLALTRIDSWLKVDFIEKLIISNIYVFDDVGSVTASPVSFIITYGYGYEDAKELNELHRRSHPFSLHHLYTVQYSVKFIKNGAVLSTESWFL